MSPVVDLDIRETVRDATRFLNTVLEYDARLSKIQSALLVLRQKIVESPENETLLEEAQQLLFELAKLMDPEFRASLKEKFEKILRFEEQVRSREENVTLKAIRSELETFRYLLQ